jgi:hypothetical protein
MRFPRDHSPQGREALVLAVRAAVEDIDRDDRCTADVQVAAFLCAAWPTAEAQNQ